MKILNVLLMLLFLTGCQKYLDKKPNKALVVPSSLADLQALLDYYPQMNNSGPLSGEVSCDDYYINDNDFNAIGYDSRRRMYLWASDHFFEPQANDWFYIYQPAFFANTVLEGLQGIEKTEFNTNNWNNIKGQALFFRANAFFEAATLFSPAYDSSTAGKDLGVPVRLSSNFNAPSTRASVKETFEQIIADLENALPLMPVSGVHPMRPSKAAAAGLLNRVFMYMHKYDSALVYGKQCLSMHPQLLDYNSLDSTASYPFPQFNEEDLFETDLPSDDPLYSSEAKIDSLLYKSYDDDDLRKALYFFDNGDGTFSYRGSPEQTDDLFGGIATDEVFLNTAECSARTGDVKNAMQLLNALLMSRWKAGTFKPLTATGSDETIFVILQERRKELVMRGLRWLDLKRLNKEGAGIVMRRYINGELYNLPPNDLRYALPIPEDVINLTGMQQNPR